MVAPWSIALDATLLSLTVYFMFALFFNKSSNLSSNDATYIALFVSFLLPALKVDSK